MNKPKGDYDTASIIASFVGFSSLSASLGTG
jgi:hypothetical protein